MSEWGGSGTVSIGDTTKKSHFDQLLDNTQYNRAQHGTLSGVVTTIHSGTATFKGEKTFQSSTIFQSTSTFSAGAVFQTEIETDGINSRTSTSGVSIEQDYYYSNGTASVCTIRSVQIEIGDWNLSTTVSINLNTIIGNVGITKSSIKSCHCVIRNDGDNNYVLVPFGVGESSTDVEGAYLVTGANAMAVKIYSSVSQWLLARVTGGAPSYNDWNATGYNRGWIYLTIQV